MVGIGSDAAANVDLGIPAAFGLFEVLFDRMAVLFDHFQTRSVAQRVDHAFLYGDLILGIRRGTSQKHRQCEGKA